MENCAAPPPTAASSHPNTGPSSALNVKFRKLTTPVAGPLIDGGLASLMTVYGSIAAPDAIPATSPRMYGGSRFVSPYRIHARHNNSTTAPGAMTGFRAPEARARAAHTRRRH